MSALPQKSDMTDFTSTRPSCTAAARAHQSGGDVAGTAQATLAKNVGLATASIEIAASYDGQNVICALSASGPLFIPLAKPMSRPAAPNVR